MPRSIALDRFCRPLAVANAAAQEAAVESDSVDDEYSEVRPAAAAEELLPSAGWACAACTFVNTQQDVCDTALEKCSVCDAKRAHRAEYRLRCVLGHTGRHAGAGHYVVDVVDWTSADRRKWTRHDDALVHEIDEVRAEREAQTQAYILMYTRVDGEAEPVDRTRSGSALQLAVARAARTALILRDAPPILSNWMPAAVASPAASSVAPATDDDDVVFMHTVASSSSGMCPIGLCPIVDPCYNVHCLHVYDSANLDLHIIQKDERRRKAASGPDDRPVLNFDVCPTCRGPLSTRADVRMGRPREIR